MDGELLVWFSWTVSRDGRLTVGAFHWGNSGIQRHQLPENRRSFPSVASWCRDSVEARRSRVLPGVQAEIVKDLDEKTREGKTKVE